MEEWKPVDLFPNYWVSNLDNVKNVKTGQVIKPFLSGHKYYYVRFYTKGDKGKGKDFLISRLVASLWIENPENKKEINHIDGNKANNAASNLEWTSRKGNMDHAKKTRLHRLNHPIRAIDIISGKGWDFYSIDRAARYFGFWKNSIIRALNRDNNVFKGICFSRLEYNAVEHTIEVSHSQESLASRSFFINDLEENVRRALTKSSQRTNG
jgi:hypothetical protein